MSRPLLPTFRTLFTLPALALALVSCGGSTDVQFVGAPDTAKCGDGVVAQTEICDDGNAVAGDGCDSECKSEAGFVCTGQPSSCAFTCNNGKLDDGETCEDGNLLAGDGCDASCQAEGSCEKPNVLKLSGKDGVLTGKVDSSTAGGGSAVPAAACGGDEVGAGADRVFEIELTEDADLTLRVEAAFNAIVRVLKKPCGGKTLDEMTCENKVGAGATETLLLPDLAPGKYYVVVDGASANAKGDFTLSAAASCPMSNVQLNRVNFASTQVELRNTGSCPVSLKNIGYRVESSGAGQSYTLPNRVIAPKKSFTVANYVNDGYDDFVVSPPAYAYTSSAAIALCRGPCVAGEASNVFDYFRAGDSAPALPDGITFDPAALTAITYSNYSSYYLRVARKGLAPKFQASDWRPTFILDPDINPPPYLYQLGTTVTDAVVEDPDEGKVLTLTNTSSSSYAARDIDLEPAFQTPKYFAYKFKDSLTSSYACYVSLGISGTDTTPTSTWTTYSARSGSAYTTTTGLDFRLGSKEPKTLAKDVWHQLEYRNIDWVTGTLDIWIDGVEHKTGATLLATGSITRINLMPYAIRTCTFTDFIAY